MSNYVEYNNKIAFHPGYYIKELVEESGLTQEDYARRLDTTPKNLSLLIRGEQSLSVDIAKKLSRMLGTSVIYWLNLQSAYDATMAEFESEKELEYEKRVFRYLDYLYFRRYFDLPELPRQINEQIKVLREFLEVSSLSVLKKDNLAVNFRCVNQELTEANRIKANVMVQLATNEALKIETPKFDRRKFESAAKYALTLTKDHRHFYPKIKSAFENAGVVFVILPNIAGSKINGATKKIGDKIMLMVNDRRLYSDTFWFTLFHEIGHIINGDFGISFEEESGEREVAADKYAEDCLIPPEEYRCFVAAKHFGINDIEQFADRIGRDSGIVLGRLQNDGYVGFNDWTLKSLRHKYQVRRQDV